MCLFRFSLGKFVTFSRFLFGTKKNNATLYSFKATLLGKVREKPGKLPHANVCARARETKRRHNPIDVKSITLSDRARGPPFDQ